MNNEEGLSEQEQEIRNLLLTASGARMPDEVFSRISQALSVEVQLRREDPEREGPLGHRRTSMAHGSHEPAAPQPRRAAELPAIDDFRAPGRSGRPGHLHLDALDGLDGERDRLDGDLVSDRDRLDDLDDCGTRD